MPDGPRQHLKEPLGVEHIGILKEILKVEDVDKKLSEISPLIISLGPLDFDAFIPGWRTAWIKDPDGRIIEVSQGFTDE